MTAWLLKTQNSPSAPDPLPLAPQAPGGRPGRGPARPGTRSAKSLLSPRFGQRAPRLLGSSVGRSRNGEKAANVNINILTVAEPLRTFFFSLALKKKITIWIILSNK